MLKCIAIVACLTFASVAFAGAPLRLPDDRPFVGVYYFGHWYVEDHLDELAAMAEQPSGA